MIRRPTFLRKFLSCILMMLLTGCSGFKKTERQITSPQTFTNKSDAALAEQQADSPFLKVHMKNGRTYVLQQWQMDSTRQQFTGHGTLLDINQNIVRQGEFQVGVDSIAILETNIIKDSGTVGALTLFTGISISRLSFPHVCS